MNEKSITTITLKKINKKSVYQYIYEHRQTAKQQIVQDLTMGFRCTAERSSISASTRKGRSATALLFIEEFLQSEF